jgi:hypothetical protein
MYAFYIYNLQSITKTLKKKLDCKLLMVYKINFGFQKIKLLLDQNII